MRAELRTTQRVAITETVLIYDAGRRFMSEAVDLSASGLRSRQPCGFVPRRGARIGVALANACVRSGVVQWLEGTDFGISFDWPLSHPALFSGGDTCSVDDLRDILKLQRAVRP